MLWASESQVELWTFQAHLHKSNKAPYFNSFQIYESYIIAVLTSPLAMDEPVDIEESLELVSPGRAVAIIQVSLHKSSHGSVKESWQCGECPNLCFLGDQEGWRGRGGGGGGRGD